jgi:hypothetical protein
MMIQIAPRDCSPADGTWRSIEGAIRIHASMAWFSTWAGGKVLRQLTALFYANMASYRMRRERFDMAISDLNRLIQINPNNPYPYRGTAYAATSGAILTSIFSEFTSAVVALESLERGRWTVHALPRPCV